MKKTGLVEVVKYFTDDFNPIDSKDFLDIRKYLIKRTWYEIMFGLIKKIFNGSNHTKCFSLRNRKYIIQPTLINLHPNKYSQDFHSYPFVVKLDKCVGSFNTLKNFLIKHISCRSKCRSDGRKCNSDQ